MHTRRVGREHGASAVEFALILPQLVLFLFGTMTFGPAFARQQDMEAAQREGAVWRRSDARSLLVRSKARYVARCANHPPEDFDVVVRPMNSLQVRTGAAGPPRYCS